MSYEDVVKKVGDLAYYYELVYHGCSQCVLKAIQDSLNVGDNLTFKAATAFAGGIARAGEECGALMGGIMAISVVYGRDRLEESIVSSGYLKAMELSVKLYEEFKKEFGSVKCSDIQKKLFGRSFNLRSEEDRKKFAEAGAYGPSGCAQVVKKGAMLAAKIILENLK
ncbi:MAG: C-GCAxxG-C-C family protein [Candidatus Methanomethylicia archaeon]